MRRVAEFRQTCRKQPFDRSNLARLSKQKPMIPEGEVVVFTDRNGLFMPVPANCPFTPAPATSSTQRGNRIDSMCYL